MASLSCSLSVSRTPATTKQTLPALSKLSKCCGPLGTEGQAPLTFEDNLQLVPQNVKDAVAGTRLRYDMPFQPTPTGILVEIITRLHRVIDVLQEPSSCTERKARVVERDRSKDSHVPLHVVFTGDKRLLYFQNKIADRVKRALISPAVTQSGVVHTLLRLEQNIWPGKQTVSAIMKEWSGLFVTPQLRQRRCCCVTADAWKTSSAAKKALPGSGSHRHLEGQVLKRKKAPCLDLTANLHTCTRKFQAIFQFKKQIV